MGFFFLFVLNDVILNLFRQSASSGSLLLTAANLELVAQIHKKNPIYQSTSDRISQHHHHRRYNANITMADGCLDAICVVSPDCGGAAGTDTVIPIDPHLMQQRLLYNKTKEDDAMSLASSTHFTMVNGVGGPQRPVKDGLCSRGHQITVLILTMSAMFMIGICAAVFMLERKCEFKIIIYFYSKQKKVN